MDRLERYRSAARDVVERYAAQKPSVGDVDSYAMIDEGRGHYVAMQVGWVRDYRVHGAFLHLDVVDGKVCVQFNGTDRDVTDDLVEAGVAPEDVVLAEERAPAARPASAGAA